jgi:hypothetical protein
MPVTGTTLLIAIGISLGVWGGSAAVRGVKHVAQKVFHRKAPPQPIITKP